MAQKTKKTAALSGSLLVRNRDDSAAGFVLSPTPAAVKTKRPPKSSKVRKPANDGKSNEQAAETARDKVEAPAEVLESEVPADEVTPQQFLTLLRQGNLAEAEAAFGQLTGLGPARVQRALRGPGGRNLAIACRALGLEQLQFVSIYILTRKLCPDLTAINAYKLTEIVNYFLDTSEETARCVLKQWQHESVEVFGHHQSTS